MYGDVVVYMVLIEWEMGVERLIVWQGKLLLVLFRFDLFTFQYFNVACSVIVRTTYIYVTVLHAGWC